MRFNCLRCGQLAETSFERFWAFSSTTLKEILVSFFFNEAKMSGDADGRTLFFSSQRPENERTEWVEVLSAHPTQDLHELHTIINKAYRAPKESGEAGWTTEGDLIVGDRIKLEDLAAELARPASEHTTLALFLCQLDGSGITRQLCGTIQISPEPEQIAEFGRFAVRTDMQSRGFGRTLLNVAEQVAVEKYAATQGQIFVLDCRPELLAVYLRRGFIHVPGHSFDLEKLGELCGISRVDSGRSLVFEMYRKPLVSSS